MDKEKQLRALKAIDGELRFRIDLSKLTDETLHALLNCYLYNGTKANDELIEAIAKDNGFFIVEYKEYYRNVNRFHYINGKKRTPITDLELNTKIKDYEFTRRA